MKIALEQARALIKTPLRQQSPRAKQAQAHAIHFGATKNLQVAKVVFDAMLTHHSVSHLASHFRQLDWSNRQAIADGFKLLLTQLEELHPESAYEH